MNNYLAAAQSKKTEDDMESGSLKHQELFVGDAFQAAIDAGLYVDAVRFPNGHYVDIGTPDELVKAVHNVTSTKT
jgi:glucose-1-phosphate thymidylyltransferase